MKLIDLFDYKLFSYEATKVVTPNLEIIVCALPNGYYVESVYYKSKKNYVTCMTLNGKTIKIVESPITEDF